MTDLLVIAICIGFLGALCLFLGVVVAFVAASHVKLWTELVGLKNSTHQIVYQNPHQPQTQPTVPGDPFAEEDFGEIPDLTDAQREALEKDLDLDNIL